MIPKGMRVNSESLTRWHQLRMTIVISQLAPTVLLITSIALLQFGLADSALAVRLGAAGILLASGILGALVQFSAASEARALAQDQTSSSKEAAAVHSSAGWLWVVQYVTPTIFVVIYAALMAALFL